MAENPAPGSGRGEDPAGGPVPGGRPHGGDGAREFASGGPLDGAFPGAALTQDLDRASGPARRCEGAADDEIAGMLGRWEATEAWCASAKLGVIRALIRRRERPGAGPARRGGLPGGWVEGLTREVSCELAVSLRAADALISLAAALDTRLVLTREALDAGVISLAKTRIIAEATAVLDDDRAAAAETLIAGQLAGKTPGQIAALIARAVVQVDPDGARKRRERAQQEDARVRFWREHAGTAALAAFGLPADEALAANQHIQDRALAYRAAGMAGTMDQLRVRAFLDAINGAPAPAPTRAPTPAPAAGAGAPDSPGQDGPADGTGGEPGPGGNSPGGDGGPGGDGPDPAGGPGNGPGNGAAVAANTMLTIPLDTLLGQAERPGEAHGLGVIDPALARQLAAAAARNPRSTWCLTVTDQDGHAIGHGCAKPARKKRKPGRPASRDDPWFSFTPAGGPRTRRRLRDLAPEDRRPGLRRHARPDSGHQLRPPLRNRRLPARPPPPPPDRGPRRAVHPAHLPARRPALRLRARRPLPPRRQDLRVQRRLPLPPRPPHQAITRLDRHPAPARLPPVDHPGRPHLHRRTHALPNLTTRLITAVGVSRALTSCDC